MTLLQAYMMLFEKRVLQMILKYPSKNPTEKTQSTAFKILR